MAWTAEITTCLSEPWCKGYRTIERILHVRTNVLGWWQRMSRARPCQQPNRTLTGYKVIRSLVLSNVQRVRILLSENQSLDLFGARSSTICNVLVPLESLIR